MYTILDIKYLVNQLNEYCDAYYNRNESLISDKEYDLLFDRLQEMEQETGIILSDSPTVRVGYEVKSDLPEVIHDFPPMLSLDKTKELSKIKKFLDDKPGLLMAKMDGLTVRITYRNGTIWRAETRGNGIKGEDITHNIFVVKDVPISIPFTDEIIVDGEVIVTRSNFAKLREKFVDNKGKKYKNPRNYAAGSIRLHDSEKAAERGLQFVAWKFVKGSEYRHFSSRLNHLEEFGFNVTPYTELVGAMNEDNYQIGIEQIQSICEKFSYPIDGCVFSFNECAYMESLGFTAHHSRAQMAFKFYDDQYETTVKSIRWTIGKTGVLTPTAIFDPVEIDGTEIKKASLHNLTIMNKLNISHNCTAYVYKANMIIPQIDHCDDDGIGKFDIPSYCPYCHSPTRRVKEKDSEVLKCTNSFCTGILLSKLTTFVSKEGMDIEGLSKGTLKTLIDLGIIENFTDVYQLWLHESQLLTLEGFGETSVTKLLEAVEKSSKTTMDHFLVALSIDNVGKTIAKTLSDYFNGDIYKFMEYLDHGYSFAAIEGIGESVSKDIYKWFDDFQNSDQVAELLDIHVHIIKPKNTSTKTSSSSSPINGKTFCITGTFVSGKRDAIKTRIENLGGIFVDGVTKKTEILFVGDKAGSKFDKAKKLGITVITEDQLNDYLEGKLNA